MSLRPATAAEIQSARAARIARVRASLGLDKKLPSAWSYAERTAYNKALAAAILADTSRSDGGAPSVQDVATAERVVTQNYEPLQSYGLGAMASDFSAELVNQAEQINPLSEQNRGRLATVLSMVLAVAALAYFGVLAFRTRPLPSRE